MDRARTICSLHNEAPRLQNPLNMGSPHHVVSTLLGPKAVRGSEIIRSLRVHKIHGLPKAPTSNLPVRGYRLRSSPCLFTSSTTITLADSQFQRIVIANPLKIQQTVFLYLWFPGACLLLTAPFLTKLHSIRSLFFHVSRTTNQQIWPTSR